MAYPFFRNQIIRRLRPDGLAHHARILWFQPGREHVALFRLDALNALPEWESAERLSAGVAGGEIEPLSDDPYAVDVLPESTLNSAEKSLRDTRLAVLAPFFADPLAALDPHGRARLIAESHDLAGASRATVYRLLRLYWRHGQVPNALVPVYRHCGAPGRERADNDPDRKKVGRRPRGFPEWRDEGVRVTTTVRDKLQDGYRYLAKGMNWIEAHREVLRLHFSHEILVDGRPKRVTLPDHLLPTLNQFKYWIRKKHRPSELIIAAKGETAYATGHRPKINTSADMAHGPGAIYQIDSTVCDIYLRSRYNPEWLVGRPILYLVFDHWSQLIVGFHVTLDSASYQGAMFALENAFCYKVPFCKAFGVEIGDADWPARHYAHGLLTDRGPDFTSKMIAEGAGTLDMRVAWTSPMRPDLKGIVEGGIGLISVEGFRWAPGAIRKREKNERKHELDAKLDMNDFTALVIRWILKYNKSHRIKNPPIAWTSTDGADPVPLQLWHEGRRLRGAMAPADPNRVRLALMERVEAVATDEGLRTADNNLHYCSAGADELVDLSRLPGHRARRFTVCRDRRDITHALLLTPKGKVAGQLVMTPKDRRRFDGWSHEEVLEFCEMRKIQSAKAGADQYRAWYEFKDHTDAIEAEARVRGGSIKPTRGPGGIPAQRAADRREAAREAQPWTTGSVPKSHGAGEPLAVGSGLPNPPEATATVPPPSASAHTTSTGVREARIALLRGLEDGEGAS
ncbi:hypothetical protein E2C06_23195 [Dankookia rubra]|uniref:Integrase catalytic domain-containing protein n=1 Tax=Dankookia rubra TaxID=1442381 RepID=A0A4R5QD14_9PROT|nr:DDE-type integrase/transposase/recombinase [Dankookia rubra]TDH60237.1 hypothetical protein E2C06_23195 [Dankookia rubra]